MKFLKLVVPCLLLVALSVPSAKAQDGLGGLGFGYLYGYGVGGFNGYAVGQYNRNLPYFSLHPPVYYGKRYTRPYGVSPFATWPQVQSNAAYAPIAAARRVTPHVGCCPAIINNPHMPAETVPSTSADQEVVLKRVEPLIIDNPYFQNSDSVQYTASRNN